MVDTGLDSLALLLLLLLLLLLPMADWMPALTSLSYLRLRLPFWREPKRCRSARFELLAEVHGQGEAELIAGEKRL